MFNFKLFYNWEHYLIEVLSWTDKYRITDNMQFTIRMGIAKHYLTKEHWKHLIFHGICRHQNGCRNTLNVQTVRFDYWTCSLSWLYWEFPNLSITSLFLLHFQCVNSNSCLSPPPSFLSPPPSPSLFLRNSPFSEVTNSLFS